MKEFGLQAVVLEPGPAMMYLTGVRWGTQRAHLRRGAAAEGRPGVGAARVRGNARARADPARARISASGRKTRARTSGSRKIMKDRGVATGRVGMEESVRFFVFDGVRKQAPKLEYVSAQPALKAAGVDLTAPAGRGGRKQ